MNIVRPCELIIPHGVQGPMKMGLGLLHNKYRCGEEEGGEGDCFSNPFSS